MRQFYLKLKIRIFFLIIFLSKKNHSIVIQKNIFISIDINFI